MISFWHQYRSEILLGALVCQIAASPLADSYPVCGAALACVLVLLLLGGVYLAKMTRFVGFWLPNPGYSRKERMA